MAQGSLRRLVGSRVLAARRVLLSLPLSAVISLWLILTASPELAHAESVSKEELAAVYLFNFAVFVEWPPTAFESERSPYRYCVLGSQTLRSSLQDVLARERIGARELRLVEARETSAWRRCHVLYLDHSAQAKTGSMLRAVEGAPVLTVGETDSFVRAGGMIGLARKGGRLAIFINRDAAAKAGLRISSKLLQLSTLIPNDTAAD